MNQTNRQQQVFALPQEAAAKRAKMMPEGGKARAAAASFSEDSSLKLPPRPLGFEFLHACISHIS